MQFWFIHSDEVSIREQIVTQITLGILSEELVPGERLPSTRDLARRFHLHANTISAAYQQLESEGWVRSRRGSGVFVRERRAPGTMTLGSSTQHLNHIFSRFLYSAHKLKIPIADIKNVMRDWLNAPTTTRFLFIEPREYLREIVLAEIEQALTLPASACSSDDPELKDKLIGAIVLVLPTNAAMIRTLLPSEAELITLQIRSAAGALAKKLPVPPDAIVGIASAWPQFLDTTRTMLIAAGIAPDALTVRNTKEPHWQDGLDQAAGVVCDVLTATRLPRTVRPIPFPVLSETAIEELKNRADVMMFARRI